MQSNLDEQPVGGGTGKAPAEFDEFGSAAQNQPDPSGPLEERIVSKNWSVRAGAFDELAQLFKQTNSQSDEVFKEHMCNWKKYLGDANPGSLEKCLDALQIFIDKCDPKVVLTCQNEIIKILIEKCVGHAKPTIKQKSLECFNMLFEVTEAFDESVETLCESLNSKNQKISTSGLVTLNSWLGNYGVKKVKPKPFLSIIETAAGSSVPAVRGEAMNFYKECYKWLGEGLKPLIANLKKQQLDDLEKEFLELKNQPKNVRLTRNEQKKQKDSELDGIIKQGEEESKDDAALDLYEAVDILTKYDGAWQEKLMEQKNWKEKKDMIEELHNDANVPKIKPGDFHGIAKVLKKMIGDSNIVVSQTAVKTCGTLAKGLRKDFEPCCKELMTPLTQKFKEKKTQLKDEIHIVLEHFMNCTNLETLQHEIVSGLNDKAPTVKQNLCLFLEKSVQKTYIDVLQRVSGEIVGTLSKFSEDPDGDVRNSGLSCLGIFKGRLGESAMAKYLQDLNPQKLQKVNESAQNVQPSKYDKPEKVEKVEKVAAPPVKAPVKKAPAKAAAKKKEEPMEIDEQPMQSSNNFDDQPIAKASSNQFDEQPIGGGQNFDDMPIGGGKKNQFDEQPIGGLEDKPVGGNKGYDLDNLDAMDPFGMNAAPAKPRKAPPARLAKKVEEEKKEDVEMLEEVQSKPPPKRPEPKAKPSTTAAAPKTASKPAGAQAQDEEATGGLSKEEAEAKVQDTFSADIVSKFEDAKWQEKVEGFKGISAQIAELQPGADVIEAVAKFTKTKMKDWKESNINLIKESIALFTVISQNCERVNKRAVSCIMPFLSDKIGDVKLQVSVAELLMALAELVTPKYVALQVIKYASQAKSPNTLKESCNILHRMTDEFGAATMPLKEMIDYGILAVNHTNPQVRTSSMALFAMMFKHAGETIRNFLKDIKESTLKLVEEEFSKVTPYKKGEYVKKRGFRGEAAVEETAAGGKGKAAAGGGGGLDDMFPRADISKQLTSKLFPMFKHANWQVRKEAAEKVEEICKAANMRIQPVGLNELMDNMKQRMVDPNKAVLKSYLQLICVLVEALGPGSKQYAKKLLPSMIQNLADKQSLVRADTVVAMDKWAEQAGAEVVITIGGPLLSQENLELRTEMMKWIIKNKEAIKLAELKESIKPLVQCLSDKTPAIRNMADELICCVMPLTGYAAFQAIISDLLPAVQLAIKPILEKVKQKVGASVQAPDAMNSSLGQKPAQVQQEPAKPVPAGPTLKKQPEAPAKPQIKAKEPQPAPKKEEPKLNQSLVGGQNNQSLVLKKKENQTPVANKLQPQRSESKDVVKPKGFTAPNQFKQEEPAQAEGITVNFGHKEKRAEFDRKNKFQLEEVKSDQLEKLKYFTTQTMGQSMTQKMFSNDFKLHVECVELYNQLMQEQPDSFLEILDIIFKWSLIRLLDSSNTKFAVTIFDFYATLFQHLEESEYQLWDFEALVIIPLLCEKAGLNNNILKDKVKKLLKMVYTIYDRQKCYHLIVQYGLGSKNLRAQSECLDELSEFIQKFGMDYSSEKEMKLVAKMADNADKNIRENALKFMGEAYIHLTDNIWRVIGDVTPKVQGLLDGRFKKLKGGLQQSSSQSNFFKPEAQLALSGGRDQSPNTGKASEGFRTTSNFGLKKTLGSGDAQKQTTTPRNLQFNKVSGAQAKQEQQQPPNNPLMRSLNQFNSSNRSNEEQKKTPQALPKKQDMLKKVMSQDHSQTIGSGLQRKAIPQTQRPESTNNDFNQVQRNSEPSNNMGKSSFAGMKQAAAATKQNQMFYQNDDDDDDLRILTDNDNFGDPELDKLQDEITKHIHQLKYADLSKRVDSLVSLNEMISAIELNKPVLVRAANDLVGAFTHVLNDIFDKNVEDIPLRFAKYFITIVLKTCSCKEIMREVSEERIFDLAEQLLTRLLIDNLDKVGDNKEGELILKNLNSSMLRLLENCNHTYIFCVLFNLLRKYKDYPLMPKLPNLIIKCLLKLSKILEKLIDKLDIEKILLAIHEHLVVINHDNKTQNDEMGIRIVKTVTNELVKLKRDGIWEAYRVIQCHNQQDNHIYRWIQIILKSLQTQGSTPSGQSSASTNINNEGEIRLIVEELRNPEKFENAIPKLYRFMEQNPQIDLNEYLQDCSQTFQKFIKTNLDKYRSTQKEENKQQEYGMMDSLKSTSNSDNGAQNQPQESEPRQTQTGTSRISEYQTKLASIKQRNMKSGADTGTNRENQQQNTNNPQQTLNTSFSAMNSSLSQKWSQINQRSNFTRREGLTGGNQVQQMSNTMTGFSGGGQGNFESKIGKGQPMNQSIGAGSSSGDNTGGATNQDLNKRLAEMKAKLQALKKPNKQ